MNNINRSARTKKNAQELGTGSVGLVVVLFMALVAALVPLGTPPAQAQAYSEGPDYKFFYATFPAPLGTMRHDWNLYGGVEKMPYYIHADVIADGFETAVRNAFATIEDDPGSHISFVYMGSTTVASEIVGNDLVCCPDPADSTNVVSYGSLPSAAVGFGGFAGTFFVDGDGNRTGEGSGAFDVTLSATANWTTSPGSNTVDVESIVLHELAHALGLDHPTTNHDTVMWDTLQNGTTKRELHPADQFALSVMYGCGDDGAGCATTCNGDSVTHDMNALGVSLLTGTAGDDVILGTPGDDVIDGGGGDDTICGLDGRDRVHGGPGDDMILGGSGIDYLFGDGGDDTLDGQGGSDRMYGGAGNDLMLGDSGADRMYGGPGDDEMRGMGGQDFMWGDAGDDLMQGNFQTDNMWGGPGNDVMFGAGGKDSLFGETGNDELSGGNNTDYLDGGPGADNANGGRGRDKPLLEPEIRASNGQFFDGSGCIAETILNCQPTP